jgi:hypothetical protein
MSARRDKEKDRLKKSDREKSSRAEWDAREERRDRRLTSSDGLDGAVTAADVPSREKKRASTRLPTNKVSPPKNTSANSSPVTKHSTSSNKRVQAALSSASDSDEVEEEASAAGATQLVEAEKKMKKQAQNSGRIQYFSTQ